MSAGSLRAENGMEAALVCSLLDERSS